MNLPSVPWAAIMAANGITASVKTNLRIFIIYLFENKVMSPFT